MMRKPPLLLLATFIFAHLAAALEPDQILLVVNKNEPQGLRLAQFYAQKRNIPDHRIVELDLPATEEIPSDVYDRQVVPVLRAFLRDQKLERKITCMVTFYGVPIRVASRVNSPQDKEELAKLQAEETALPAKIEPLVQALERVARDGDATFQPKSGVRLENLGQRADAALKHLSERLNQSSPADRGLLHAKVMAALEPILGPMGMLERQLKEAYAGTSRSAASRPVSQPSTQSAGMFVRFRNAVIEARERKFEPEARQRLRQLVSGNLGPFEYAKLLEAQIAYFQTENTNAAFDSELALLWWEYPKTRWQNNPLHYGMKGPTASPVMMVMRLDAPEPETVKKLIIDSLTAEALGLQGSVVIDSRNLPVMSGGKVDAYGQYDQTLRNLAHLLRTKAKLQVVFDEQPDVLPAGSVKNVAVYMGWYSVNQYVAACQFNPGAVGFHLASFTMVTLRNNSGGGWVRGLLNDGIAATLGAVAEPYLQAFPTADDFFPLLFTGKLTLAEVYWKTTPMTSWMISMIGDPLYTPYKTNPALAVEDLPPRLQEIFKKPAGVR